LIKLSFHTDFVNVAVDLVSHIIHQTLTTMWYRNTHRKRDLKL